MKLCFLLQDQSLPVCHAGQVVIEQKIESEKEEIGRKRLEKEREGSEGETHGGRKSETTRAEDECCEDDREGRRVRDRSCGANKRHRERWRDGFD